MVVISGTTLKGCTSLRQGTGMGRAGCHGAGISIVQRDGGYKWEKGSGKIGVKIVPQSR